MVYGVWRYSRIQPLNTALDGGERGQRCRYQQQRRLGGLQGRSGRNGDDTNLLPVPVTETRILGCIARSLIAVLASLFRLKVGWKWILKKPDVKMWTEFSWVWCDPMPGSYECANYTGYTQKNGAVSKVNKKFISHLTRAQRTPSAAATVQVSHALITILQCMHPGSHDTHPHGNQIHRRLGVACPL
jgi:hypothetical protein